MSSNPSPPAKYSIEIVTFQRLRLTPILSRDFRDLSHQLSYQSLPETQIAVFQRHIPRRISEGDF